MRIISGFLGGRRCHPPAKGWPTRPTTDIAKEALYNILQGRIDFSAVRFLDLFGGTGSHCFEMISRGCTDVTYVDSFRPCCAFVRKTAEELSIADHLRVVCSDVFKFCKRSKESWDFIFADPPYGEDMLDKIPEVVFVHQLLKTDGILVVEHSARNDFSMDPLFVELRIYGETQFSFFQKPGR